MTSMDRLLGGDLGRRWPHFVAGAAAGLAAGWFLRRSTRSPEDEEREGAGTDPRPREGSAPLSRLREAWDDAVEGASGGLASARQLVAPEPVLDADALHEMLASMEGAAGCRLRVLSDGIVEVVGSCASREELAGLIEALAAAPGVEVVVNRVWTPDSPGSGEPAGDTPAH